MISYSEKKLTFNFDQAWERPTWASLKQRFLIGPIELLHYKLFTYYLDNMGTMRAGLIKRVLPALRRDDVNAVIYELKVPRLWQKKLFEDFASKSIMYNEFKVRVNSSDHLIQPSLVTRYSEDLSNSRPATDEYTSLVIDKKLKKFRFLNYRSRVGYKKLNSELLESVSDQISKFVDSSVVSIEPNNENTVLESILTTPGLFDHVSEGMKTYGGYVDVPGEIYKDGADPLKTCLFHLPQGYRQRSKWMFNSNTGLNIAVIKDGQSNYLIDQRDEALREAGVPDRLLNKPIRYNEYLPDTGIIGMIADFTRGYIISPSKDLTLVIDDIEDDITLKMYIGGKVLQPAAFKGYRYIERTPDELVEVREKTRLENEAWRAKHAAEEAEKAQAAFEAAKASLNESDVKKEADETLGTALI